MRSQTRSMSRYGLLVTSLLTLLACGSASAYYYSNWNYRVIPVNSGRMALAGAHNGEGFRGYWCASTAGCTVDQRTTAPGGNTWIRSRGRCHSWSLGSTIYYSDWVPPGGKPLAVTSLKWCPSDRPIMTAPEVTVASDGYSVFQY